jgi:putative ABC transport system permease protein
VKPLEGIRQALGSIRANKLRSFLTMLGVIIGVGSMLLMVAVVEGFQTNIRKQFEGLGSRLVFVFYNPDQNARRKARRTFDGLELTDANAIRTECDMISNVAAELDLGTTQVMSNGQQWSIQTLAVEPEFQSVRNMRAERGRFIDSEDLAEWRPVCVIGVEAARKAFGTRDPLGRDLQLYVPPNGEPARFTVVGVMEKRGRAIDGNYDDRIYMPITTAQKRLLGTRNVGVIYAQARRPEETEAAMDQIWSTLMRRHGNRPDFTVDSQSRILETLGRIMLILSGVLAGIASLALLVGGIGIMNIMLVSVTERTREIGIRKAVGARQKDVLLQFLTEAMTLSGMGGLVGVACGYGAAAIVAAVARDNLPARVPLWAALVGFAFACAVGLVSGVYPAFRAARLDPIQALRYE